MSLTLFPFRAIALPKMYLVDSNTGQPLNRSTNSLPLQSASAIGDAEIKRDRHGRLVMVRHKGSSVYGDGVSMSGSEMITFDDIRRSVEKMKENEEEEKKSEKGSKKSVKGSQKGSQKGSEKGKDEKKDEAKKDAEASGGFTADEDAQLREFKALTGKETKSWKQIAEEMGKDKNDLQAHWRELQAADREGGGGEDKKPDDKKVEEPKADGKKDEGGKGKDGKGKDGNGKQGANEEQKAEEKKEGNGGGQQKMDQFVFTEEQDEELKACMAAGTNWKLTAKAVHKSQAACKKRWEEIGGDAAKADEPKKEEPKKEASKKEEPKKEESKKEQAGSTKAKSVAKSETKKEEVKKPASVKAPSKAASVAGSVRSTRSSVKFSIREWRTLQEDEFFTFEELQVLCQLIGKNGDGSWLRIASAFHDRTGRRVHPEDIREKFEALGNVSV